MIKRFALLITLLLLTRPASAAFTLSWEMGWGEGACGANPVIAVPAAKSAVATDTLIVVIRVCGASATCAAPTSAGVTWKQPAGSPYTNNGNYGTLCAFTGQVTSTQAANTSYAFTVSTGQSADYDMFDVTGANVTTPIDVYTPGSGPAGTQQTTYAQSATLSFGDFVLSLGVAATGTIVTGFTLPAGFTATGTQGAGEAAGGYKVFSSGATGTLTTTWTNLAQWNNWFIALAPANATTSTQGFFFAP